MTRLTCREQLQLVTPLQVERLQVAEISEAFGHQKLDKKMILNDFNGNLLSGSDASCIGA